MSGRVLALVTDLLFATKISSTAKSLGAPVDVVRGVVPLRERVAAGAASLVIIDLNADASDTIEAIRAVKAARPAVRTVAYVSHVQTELAAAAREAGADLVLPRSRFTAELPAILARAGADVGGGGPDPV
jgi:DNA-binding NarL/FixJ family response regulator